MKLAFTRPIALLMALAVFGFGCGPTSSDGGATTTTVQRQNPAEAPLEIMPGLEPTLAPTEDGPWRVPGRSASLCDHPYYPLRPGYEVVYRDYYIEPRVDGRPGLPLQKLYTSRVQQVEGGRAVVETTFQDPVIRSTQTIDCLPDGLKAQGYVDLSMLRGGRGTTARTTESAGYILPRDLRVGSEWDQSFSFTTQLPADRLQPRAVEVKGKVETHRRAFAEESITLPAGTFTAIIVDSRTVSTMEFPGGGAVPIELMGQEWWVRGKGLVKVISGLVGANSATSEAETIIVP